jgi:hypothetical protein
MDIPHVGSREMTSLSPLMFQSITLSTILDWEFVIRRSNNND